VNYDEYLESKIKTIRTAGIEITENEINAMLFPFQRAIAVKALRAGRYAVFADCGLGKTPIQLEWAKWVNLKTGLPVLILCPLAVAGQTIQEGVKFGVSVTRYTEGGLIQIANYEQIEHINPSLYGGIVLDESSILKNYTGHYKRKIIESFARTQYKLACTATPAPNDLNEIGNHAEFLNVMDATDMRMRWFIRDEGMNNYRLKGHAEHDFYAWIGSWASVLRRPSDLGFSDEGFVLPGLNFIEHQIQTEHRENGKLFNDVSVNATNFHAELRITLVPRLDDAAKIVNGSNERFIVWIEQDIESKKAGQLIPESVEVYGGEKPESKESKLLGFGRGEFRVLVTKKKIAQFGLNYQACNNQVFASLDFSFEGLYQAVRRSYRFGQKKPVNIYIITTDTMQNVVASIREKENQFNEMMEKTSRYANDKTYGLTMNYNRKETKTDSYHLINGDSVEVIKGVEDNSMDLIVYSPPFSNLFTYSDSIRDMGNCETDEEFFEGYSFLLSDLYRILRPGRIMAVHTKDLAVYKNSSGYSGLYNFTGLVHKAIEDAGFKYHSKITIWTDPVLEMQRTKTQRLLYKQVTSDSSYTGIGLPEYVTLFRKWEGDEEEWTPITGLDKSNFPLDTWQKWASPVWFDIRRTDVLNGWKYARDEKDEKHIAPLQLEVIKRIVMLWSNEGETVFTPFAGIGSELYQSVKYGRKAVGIELKESYYETACRNMSDLLLEFDQVEMKF
jgi:DNA modification methylase